MWKKRAGYGIMILSGGILFFLSGQIFFALVAAGLLVLAGVMWVLIHRDAKRIRLEISVPESARAGSMLSLELTCSGKERICAGRKLLADIRSKNEMFGEEKRENVSVLFSGRQIECHTLLLPMEHCGQTELDVSNIWIEDLLGLFRVKAGNAIRRYCTVYPRRFQLQIEKAARRTGAQEEEGIMENRKGNDRSEIYDIREYAPGDDIRSIHWKLSGKMDSLVIREASDPSHYRVAILADYGSEHWDEKFREEKEKEWDTVIAAGAAAGRELVEKGEKYCMIFPGEDGLKICEIENRQDYAKMIAQWMGMPMKKPQGTGYRYFMNQHLEQRFGRLIILAAGKYEQNLVETGSRIAVTVISAEDSLDTQKNNRISDTCEIVEIPVKNTEGVCRIIC